MNMNQTYCGKTCETCPDRERLGCPGCQQGPGRPGLQAGCPIAACCREKNHANCESCTDRGCSVRSRSANMVALREEEAARAARQDARRQEVIGHMNKYLPFLWSMAVIRIVLAGFMLISAIFSGMEAVEPFADIAGWIMDIAALLFYLKMASAEPGFKTAAVFLGITHALSLVGLFLGEGGLSALLDIVILGPSLYGQYSLYTAYASVCTYVSYDLATQWERLWKIYRNLLLAIIPGFLLALITPVVAYFGILAFAGMMLYLVILECTNLYKTKQAFEDAE